jgi:hypothetical protein
MAIEDDEGAARLAQGARESMAKDAADGPDEDSAWRGEVLTEFRRRLNHAKEHQREWREEAKSLYDLRAGHQWDPVDEARMRDEMRPYVTFNVTAKFLDAVEGLQINNRQEIHYYPREQGDAKTNELLTGTVEWARDLCSAEDEESDAFGDAILTGMGWVECYLNQDNDPAGWPCVERRDPLEMYWDPGARKKNLSDARFVVRVRYVDPDEMRRMFGEGGPLRADNLIDVSIDDDPMRDLVERPEDYDGLPSSNRPQWKAGRVPVAHYEFWRHEQRIHVDSQLGARDFRVEEWATIEPLLRAQGIQYRQQQVQRRVYYRAFIAPDGLRELAESPYQRGFTFHAITGRRDRNRGTWYGIGRALLDPQRWVNKFFSSLLYTIMTNAKGGVIAEEGTFADPKKAEADWAKPNAIVYTTPGAVVNGKLKDRDPPRYPEGMDRLMQFALQALPETSGLNMELLGLADRAQAGVLEAQRKQSAMAIIAWAFDAMRRYYRGVGRQLADYISLYVPENTLVRVNGDQGAEYVPLLKEQLAQDYDVIVDEAPTSVNMRERVWGMLQTIVPALLQAGIQIPPDVLDYAPLPPDLAQKWKQMLTEPSPQQQQQQQAAQEQMMAVIRKTIGEAMRAEADAHLKQAQTAKTQAEAENLPVEGANMAAKLGVTMGGGGLKPNQGMQ